jgi:hypothetical protein
MIDIVSIASYSLKELKNQIFFRATPNNSAGVFKYRKKINNMYTSWILLLSIFKIIFFKVVFLLFPINCQEGSKAVKKLG